MEHQHRFVADENGVEICACGEVLLSPEEELAMVEIKHDALTAPLAPRSERRRMIERLAERIPELGWDSEKVDEILDAQEDPEQGRDSWRRLGHEVWDERGEEV